jgi:hypothetical protein
LYCHVWGVCMTNITGSGFDDRIYWHFFTITISNNSSQSLVSYDMLHSLLDYECLLFYYDWLGSDLRTVRFYCDCLERRLSYDWIVLLFTAPCIVYRVSMETVCCLAVVTGACLQNHLFVAQWTSALSPLFRLSGVIHNMESVSRLVFILIYAYWWNAYWKFSRKIFKFLFLATVFTDNPSIDSLLYFTNIKSI